MKKTANIIVTKAMLNIHTMKEILSVWVIGKKSITL